MEAKRLVPAPFTGVTSGGLASPIRVEIEAQLGQPRLGYLNVKNESLRICSSQSELAISRQVVVTCDCYIHETKAGKSHGSTSNFITYVFPANEHCLLALAFIFMHFCSPRFQYSLIKRNTNYKTQSQGDYGSSFSHAFFSPPSCMRLEGDFLNPE